MPLPGGRLIDAPKHPPKTQNMMLEVRVELKKAQVAEMEKDLKALNAQLEAANSRNTSLSATAAELTTTLTAATEQHTTATAQRTEAEARHSAWLAEQGPALADLTARLQNSEDEWGQFYGTSAGGLKESLEAWQARRLELETDRARLDTDGAALAANVGEMAAKKEKLEAAQAIVIQTAVIAGQLDTKLGVIRAAAADAKADVEVPDEDGDDIPILRRMTMSHKSPSFSGFGLAGGRGSVTK